jgi:ATP-dependent protease HslVU (ClpYQ) peptidase subunit
MTTIAARNGIVAYDSRIVGGDHVSSETTHKAMIGKRHPVIYAGAGTVTSFMSYIDYLERKRKLPWEVGANWKHGDSPTLADDSAVLVAHKDGRVFFFEEDGWYEAKGVFHALGSGASAAIAAMHMKASAARAVQIAIKVDPNSGGPVNVLRLADIPERNKRRG